MLSKEEITTLESLLNKGKFFMKGNKSKIGAYASISGRFLERQQDTDNKWAWIIGKEMQKQNK